MYYINAMWLSNINRYVTGCNIFVLMKDGSVWGIGRNNRKLISSSKKKKYSQFVKIMDGGVKQIAACTDHVLVVKKDNTLWGGEEHSNH